MSKYDMAFNPDDYATVAQRIELFYSRFPIGRINTELVQKLDGEITFKALVFRDKSETAPAATGWASEREGDGDINKVACLENTETSAVGRALANLGFTASTKRPSREEMEKAARARSKLSFPSQKPSATLQMKANAADDLLQLIARVERHGFSAVRATTLRSFVNALPGLPHSRIRKIEASLRLWLRRHSL